MRGSCRLLVKVKGNTANLNQESQKRMKLAEIRTKHLNELKKGEEDKPFGRADKHVITAYTEIEAEDRAEMEKVCFCFCLFLFVSLVLTFQKTGTPPGMIERKLMENRAQWLAQTNAAWEAAQPKKAEPSAAAGSVVSGKA